MHGQTVESFVLQPSFVLMHRVAVKGRISVDKLDTLLARDDIQAALGAAVASACSEVITNHMAEILAGDAE